MDNEAAENQQELFLDHIDQKARSIPFGYTSRGEARGYQSSPAYKRSRPPSWVKENRIRDTTSNLDYEIVSIEEEHNPLVDYL